ncbi:unnamed protein product [Blepharisma stoltei]|uniref:Receptor expression-enhancing protein n=1 Tax=Blepharisma stoltei TaxID=1481888 RepID=A0AAU9J0X4_9CILI|nr:unnamed protein product [Blepharisma stoltei]
MAAQSDYLDSLTQHFQTVPLVKQISEKSGLPASYVAIGFIGFSFMLVLFGICSGLMVNVVGILYPAYVSFKAIESKETDDDKQWLTYWVIFAGYSFLDHFIDILFFWFPFYHTIKLIVLVWLFWPKTLGAIWVYNHIVSPFLKQHEGFIDAALGGDKSS